MHTVDADQQNPADAVSPVDVPLVEVIFLRDGGAYRTGSCERKESKCLFHLHFNCDLEHRCYEEPCNEGVTET